MNRMPLTDDDRVFLDKLRIASPEDELRIYEHHQPTAQEVAQATIRRMTDPFGVLEDMKAIMAYWDTLTPKEQADYAPFIWSKT